jgi:amino acid permease
MGLFIRTGSIIVLAGSLGSLLSYIVAGLMVTAVMLCLSEMVSIRSTPGAIFEYPQRYVDPALGFAVGIIYWYEFIVSKVPITDCC